MEVLCALAGVLYAYTKHGYALLALAFIFCTGLRLRYPLVFILGFAWAWGHQWYQLPPLPSPVLSKVKIQGSVISIPNSNAHKTQFQFLVDTLEGKPQNIPLLLAWYNHPPEIHAGEHWQLEVKLKQPHNLRNPGSFDYASWLAARHIAMQGYVRSGLKLENKVNNGPLAWLKMREYWGNAVARQAPNTVTAGIVQALTLGLTQEINQELWGLFRRTGTTHLMVISGAHIGFVAALIFKIVHWFWRCSAIACSVLPAARMASVSAFITALAYAALAGFAVPAQRSFVGSALGGLRFLGKQRLSSWQIWRYGLWFALIFEPHAVLLPGFYLSFLAVAILMLVNQRWRFSGYPNTLLMQFSCLLGLIPLTLFWFGYGSVTGFIANLFAIPLVGFLIVPLALFTLLILPFEFSSLCMDALNGLISLLLHWLNWVDALSFLNPEFGFAPLHRAFALMGGVLLLVILPLKTFRLVAILLMISAFFPCYPTIKSSEALIRVLDVGQGLAVFVQTKKHNLLYDTGDAFYQGSDMGKLVILPLFQTLGVRKLDSVVISHPDKDHYGGLASVEASMPVGSLIVNDPGHYKRGFSCHEYPQWEWDGVLFRFFPIKKDFREKNNNSCILQILTKNQSMLLTGDIEKPAEEYLIRKYGAELQSSVLLVAHHGSKTSSSHDFLRQVSPLYAIASLGFDNRFHFPHPHTLAMFRDLRIPFYSTKDNGMITLRLGSGAEILEGEKVLCSPSAKKPGSKL